jgi:subtilase family serine protease
LNPATGSTITPCAIPAGTAAGSYYVLAVVDEAGAVLETVETNNTRATTTKLAIGPDLIPVTLTALASGTTVTVSDQVKNQGNQSAGAFTINYYLSSDTLYQAGTDLLLCSRSVAGLAVGISDPSTGTTATPCTAGVIGSYYVLAVVDEASAVTETLETNNTKATATKLTIP